MLRALGIVFLVLLVMLMAVGGGFLSHFLTRINSPQVQNQNLQQVNHAVSPGGGAYPANYQSAPLPFPQSSQMQAVPVQQQVNPIPVTVNQNPLSQQPNALRQVNAVAGTLTPATLASTAVMLVPQKEFKIVQVESTDKIIWRDKLLLNNGKKQLLIKSGAPLVITIEQTEDENPANPNDIIKFVLKSNTSSNEIESDTPEVISSGKQIRATFALGNDFQAGVYDFELKTNSNADLKEVGQATKFIYPSLNLKPEIKYISVHKYGNREFQSDATYHVYDGFIRVYLLSATGQESFLFVDNQNQYLKNVTVTRKTKLAGSNNYWSYDLRIPFDNLLQGNIFVLHQQGSMHAYADTAIKVSKLNELREGVNILSVKLCDSSNNELKHQGTGNYFTNNSECQLRIQVNNGIDNGNLVGVQFVVLDSKGNLLSEKVIEEVSEQATVTEGESEVEPAAASEVANPSTYSINLPIHLPNVGKYTLFPKLFQGIQALPSIQIAPVQVSYASGAPPKGIVDASSFSQIAGENEFTISFDKNYPVDQSTITKPFTEKIVISKEGGISDNLAIKSAEYLAPNNAIKFQLENATSPGLYHLEIKETVTDLHGIAMTGTYDVPKLVASGDVTVGITRGLQGSTGNYVQYPEYTPPRENSVGFNPSDKVVTRVARLYYFRDAHRVAQIINRKIRSYNRHGVEMKNQLAGEALKKAEAATDLRKQFEKNAINAAVKTRQAEAKLEDLQQALSRRSNETQQIQRDIQEMEGDLNRQRFLKSRDYANLPGLSDSEKEAEQEELQKLNEKISQEQTEVQLERARLSLSTANTDSALTRSRIQTAQTAVETARAEEIRLNDEWEVSQRKEERAYAEEFRRRVAAAHEDPDSFAEGVPNSKDPVEQVSLSVIGTGLIQLRGPLKGVNEVRTMINQIDAPVGQVRITLHTVQINGEHADRMEKVAMQIQRYIDHSRFLTMQSAQMLRNSIVKIASQKAAQVDAMCPEHSQHARDLKYVEAFFGADFLHALYEMDSEFLKTGNKLLSINSMDSTSLSSALFLMALAKNSVRMEILADFQMQIETQLPLDEQDYFVASGMTSKHDFKKFQFLAHNAKFVSLRGFFNADVMGDDTLNPLQREFIRLAQIFKSRLVTEIELKERVLERSVIEDRIGDYHKMMLEAQNDEDQARKAVQEARKVRTQELIKLTKVFQNMVDILVQDARSQLPDVSELIDLDKDWRFEKDAPIRSKVIAIENAAKKAGIDAITAEANVSSARKELVAQQKLLTRRRFLIFQGDKFRYYIPPTESSEGEITDSSNEVVIIDCIDTVTMKSYDKSLWDDKWNHMIQSITIELQDLHNICNKFNYLEPEHQILLRKENHYFDKFRINYCEKNPEGDYIQPLKVENDKTKIGNVILTLSIGISEYSKLIEAIKIQTREYETRAKSILVKIDQNFQEAYQNWLSLSNQFISQYKDKELKAKAQREINKVNESFQKLFDAEIKEKTAIALLEGSRRPLDHKKFLDMLVDDVEEKYIDLIEGTRAHTANIDNYMQRIATALEDDFKTQYYDPAFRYVRETSRYWDVSFAQVEQTSILTNNRQFARVAPQATMEFDLPKRDILINEAFESALAAYSDYGALMNDPNFLALTKLYGGQPASEIYTAEGFSPRIRNVLPGTPSVMDEEYLSQGPSGPPKFGSQLEGLIPDPSVYKFETGTAFEVRPVIQPDGQAVVFHLNYEYTTNIREPIRADEKHLGRVKRHFIDTDVQTGNYELREVSRYQVALKASRTSRGVPLLEDVPGLGVLFRPLPQGEASLQENIIMAQSVIYPTLFDIMGLRWAPAVADLDTISLRDQEFVTRNRQRVLKNKVSDFSSGQVDGFLDIPEKQRRADLYRTQQTIPYNHPSGYTGPGLNIKDSNLQEGYQPEDIRRPSRYIPGKDPAFIPGATEEWAPPAGSPRMQNVPLQEGAQPSFESQDSADFQEQQTRNIQPQKSNQSARKHVSRIPGAGSPRSIPPAPHSPVLMAPPSTSATQNRKYFDRQLNPTSFEEEAAPSGRFKFSSPLKALKNLNFKKSDPKQPAGHVRPIKYENTSPHTEESPQGLFGIPSIVKPHQVKPISTQTEQKPAKPSLWSRFSEKLPGLPHSRK
ncbi:hypothetical protein [Gimesia sp.]|uniref:hypothetical protein n=1 Tax=Gimesia sp. TaxID=2024833 RepID=UPI003A8F460E